MFWQGRASASATGVGAGPRVRGTSRHAADAVYRCYGVRLRSNTRLNRCAACIVAPLAVGFCRHQGSTVRAGRRWYRWHANLGQSRWNLSRAESTTTTRTRTTTKKCNIIATNYSNSTKKMPHAACCGPPSSGRGSLWGPKITSRTPSLLAL